MTEHPIPTPPSPGRRTYVAEITDPRDGQPHVLEADSPERLDRLTAALLDQLDDQADAVSER